MQLQNVSSVGGKWADKDKIKNGTKIKIVSEATVVDSGQFGPQTVAKVLIQGEPDPANFALNKSSVRALITAFGTETKNWMGKVVTASVRRESVSGRNVNVIRLIPEGYEVAEDDNGYTVIRPVQLTSAGTKVPDFVPSEDINPADIPF